MSQPRTHQFMCVCVFICICCFVSQKSGRLSLFPSFFPSFFLSSFLSCNLLFRPGFHCLIPSLSLACSFLPILISHFHVCRVILQQFVRPFNVYRKCPIIRRTHMQRLHCRTSQALTSSTHTHTHIRFILSIHPCCLQQRGKFS